MAKSVVVTVTGSGSDAVISVCPDPIDVGRSNKRVYLKFRMNSDGWEMAGIGGLPESEFEDEGKDGKGWKVKDKNRTVADYKYDVSVKEVSSGTVVTLDPTIRNGGRNDR